MGQFVSSLFGGGGNSTATADANRQREIQSIAQSRAEQTAQDNAATTARQSGAAGRAPRGRRLLLSPESGGASTVGQAT